MAFPASIATQTDLLGVGNRSITLLSGFLSAEATTVAVVSTATFSDVGVITIDNEIIKYVGKTSTEFTGCSRGHDSTTPSSHSNGSMIRGNIVAAHHNLMVAEMIAVQKHLHGVMRNVLSYGADADAFQAAVDVGPGTIVVPVGTFILDHSVVLASNITIMGSAGTVITTDGDFPMFQTTGAIENVRFEGITFLGLGQNYAVGDAGAAIFLDTNDADGLIVDHCLFKNLVFGVDGYPGQNNINVSNSRFYGMSGAAIRIFSSSNGIVTGNYINGDRTGVGDEVKMVIGIWISSGNAGETGGENWTISNNQVFHTKNEGIMLRSAYSTLTGNTVRYATGATSYGITVEGTGNNYTPGDPPAGYYNIVANNLVSDCDGGIRSSGDYANKGDSPKDVLIANNDVRNITETNLCGIFIDTVAGTDATLVRYHITGNKIYNVSGGGGAVGILVRGISNSAITNNFIHTTNRAGIQVDAGLFSGNYSNNVTVIGNTIIDPGVTGFANAIYLETRRSSGMANIVVMNNIMYIGNYSSRGIDVSAGQTDASTDCSFIGNVIYGSTGLNYSALRLAGQNLTIIGNVGHDINSDAVITFTPNGSTYYSIREYLQTKNGIVNTMGSLQNVGANSQSTDIKQATTTKTAMSGATVTASNLIPAGSLVVGVTLRVTTAIEGATSFDIGDGTDVDRWGAAIAIALNTTTTLANATIAIAPIYTAATSIVLTANGSNFTAGAVRITVHYISLTAPTG